MLKEIFYSVINWRESIVTQSSNRKIKQYPSTFMHDYERKQSAKLMRVNHIGEVCAQALYTGQLLMARENDLKKTLLHAKSEEIDHLVWCYGALNRLHSNPSIIIPTWFSGALMLSLIFSITGDEYNALFLEETELQVARHLEKHLQLMPWSDTISLEILNTMLEEEIEHAKNAKSFTDKEMHHSLKMFMRLNAKVMTSLGQYI